MRLPYKHLFGPVPSRRFGRSLGVDMVPFKTCTFDCVFCQLGRTTHKTEKRREYVPTEEIVNELRQWFAAAGGADYVTLAGSGEPTLHAGFGEIVEVIRGQGDIPVLLLSNGSLLADPEVRLSASRANVVKASLSAWDDASLQRLNRPCRELRFQALVDGLTRFREEYDGRLYIEVFAVDGVNATRERMSRIAGILNPVGADRVQLNTAVRPPAESFVRPVSRKRLAELALLFEPAAEVIAEYQAGESDRFSDNEQEILALLQRRPCTLDDLAASFAMHRNEVSKYLGKLTRSGLADSETRGNNTYFTAIRSDEECHADL